MVQEAFTIRVASLVRDGVLRSGSRGELCWRHPIYGDVKCRFEVSGNGEGLELTLRYGVGSKGHVTSIALVPELQSTDWWMVCPRPGCGRRVAKLFLPVGSESFGCQACHGYSNEWVSRESL